ncbi:130.4 kDa protein [Psammotettix alienus reovirus]|nr:130.4 kDa protein [Psammotettix alienus reovirus]
MQFDNDTVPNMNPPIIPQPSSSSNTKKESLKFLTAASKSAIYSGSPSVPVFTTMFSSPSSQVFPQSNEPSEAPNVRLNSLRTKLATTTTIKASLAICPTMERVLFGDTKLRETFPILRTVEALFFSDSTACDCRGLDITNSIFREVGNVCRTRYLGNQTPLNQLLEKRFFSPHTLVQPITLCANHSNSCSFVQPVNPVRVTTEKIDFTKLTNTDFKILLPQIVSGDLQMSKGFAVATVEHFNLRKQLQDLLKKRGSHFPVGHVECVQTSNITHMLCVAKPTVTDNIPDDVVKELCDLIPFFAAANTSDVIVLPALFCGEDKTRARMTRPKLLTILKDSLACCQIPAFVSIPDLKSHQTSNLTKSGQFYLVPSSHPRVSPDAEQLIGANLFGLNASNPTPSINGATQSSSPVDPSPNIKISDTTDMTTQNQGSLLLKEFSNQINSLPGDYATYFTALSISDQERLLNKFKYQQLHLAVLHGSVPHRQRPNLHGLIMPIGGGKSTLERKFNDYFISAESVFTLADYIDISRGTSVDDIFNHHAEQGRYDGKIVLCHSVRVAYNIGCSVLGCVMFTDLTCFSNKPERLNHAAQSREELSNVPVQRKFQQPNGFENWLSESIPNSNKLSLNDVIAILIEFFKNENTLEQLRTASLSVSDIKTYLLDFNVFEAETYINWYLAQSKTTFDSQLTQSVGNDLVDNQSSIKLQPENSDGVNKFPSSLKNKATDQHSQSIDPTTPQPAAQSNWHEDPEITPLCSQQNQSNEQKNNIAHCECNSLRIELLSLKSRIVALESSSKATETELYNTKISLDDFKKQNSDLLAQNESLKKQNENLLTQNALLKKETDELKTQNALLQQQLTSAKDAHGDSNSKNVSQLQEELQNLTTSLETQKELNQNHTSTINALTSKLQEVTALEHLAKSQSEEHFQHIEKLKNELEHSLERLDEFKNAPCNECTITSDKYAKTQSELKLLQEQLAAQTDSRTKEVGNLQRTITDLEVELAKFKNDHSISLNHVRQLEAQLKEQANLLNMTSSSTESSIKIDLETKIQKLENELAKFENEKARASKVAAYPSISKKAITTLETVLKLCSTNPEMCALLCPLVNDFGLRASVMTRVLTSYTKSLDDNDEKTYLMSFVSQVLTLPHGYLIALNGSDDEFDAMIQKFYTGQNMSS